MCSYVSVLCPICISIEEIAYTYVHMQDKVRYQYWASILCSASPMFLKQSIHWTWVCQFGWTAWGKHPRILAVKPLGIRTRLKGTCHQFGFVSEQSVRNWTYMFIFGEQTLDWIKHFSFLSFFFLMKKTHSIFSHISLSLHS